MSTLNVRIVCAADTRSVCDN